MSVLTIRDVPDEVKQALTQEAREAGKSLQSYVLDVLTRQADFSRNRRLVMEIADDVGFHGGAGTSAPDAADVLAQAREQRGPAGRGHTR